MGLDNEQVQKLSGIFQHAENVGEETADKLARRMAKEAETLDEALEVIHKDERVQEDLAEISGVGKKTLANVVTLVGEIIEGTRVVVFDTLDTVRVVTEDYLDVRNRKKSEGYSYEGENPENVENKANQQ